MNDHPLANGRCPVGPDTREACLNAVLRTYPTGEVTPTGLSGFVFEWAHQKGADFTNMELEPKT